jgi:hypothetical protein
LKARTDGRPPLFTRDQLPASIEALIAPYSMPEPPPRRRGTGRPRNQPRRVLDPDLRYAQVDKHRDGGRVVAVCQRIIFGSPEVITEILGDKHIYTSDVERDNLTSRQRNGRVVGTTLSYAKKNDDLQRHLNLEDAVVNFVRPHQALRMTLPRPIPGRTWHQRTPAMQQASQIIDGPWKRYVHTVFHHLEGKPLIPGFRVQHRKIRDLNMIFQPIPMA